jgi:GNAT superfamily N-acetyltransferase
MAKSHPKALIRRCVEDDWRDLRRLHIKLALKFPLVVDVDLNEVLATPDVKWQEYAWACAHSADQALCVASLGEREVGMGHVHLSDQRGRLAMVFVEDTERRQGIGTGIVASLGQWVGDRGASGLVCHIPDDTDGSHLAQSLGWTRTDEIFFTQHGLAERKWTTSLP